MRGFESRRGYHSSPIPSRCTGLPAPRGNAPRGNPAGKAPRMRICGSAWRPIGHRTLRAPLRKADALRNEARLRGQRKPSPRGRALPLRPGRGAARALPGRTRRRHRASGLRHRRVAGDEDAAVARTRAAVPRAAEGLRSTEQPEGRGRRAGFATSIDKPRVSGTLRSELRSSEITPPQRRVRKWRTGSAGESGKSTLNALSGRQGVNQQSPGSCHTREL